MILGPSSCKFPYAAIIYVMLFKYKYTEHKKTDHFQQNVCMHKEHNPDD